MLTPDQFLRKGLLLVGYDRRHTLAPDQKIKNFGALVQIAARHVSHIFVSLKSVRPQDHNHKTRGETMPPKKKASSWKASEAKKILMKHFCSVEIPLDSADMAPQDAFQQWPEFAKFDSCYKNFATRLNAAQKKIHEKNSRASLDGLALAHDWQLFPKAATNYRDEPRWEGSAAE